MLTVLSRNSTARNSEAAQSRSPWMTLVLALITTVVMIAVMTVVMTVATIAIGTTVTGRTEVIAATVQDPPAVEAATTMIVVPGPHPPGGRLMIEGLQGRIMTDAAMTKDVVKKEKIATRTELQDSRTGMVVGPVERSLYIRTQAQSGQRRRSMVFTVQLGLLLQCSHLLYMALYFAVWFHRFHEAPPIVLQFIKPIKLGDFPPKPSGEPCPRIGTPDGISDLNAHSAIW